MAACASVEEGRSTSTDPVLTEQEKYNWSEEETKYFLGLYKDYEWYFADTKYTNKSVWKKLAGKMSEAGYSSSATNCSNRWKTLKASFQRTMKKNGVSGEGRHTCRFYSELSDILGHKPTTKPKYATGNNDRQTVFGETIQTSTCLNNETVGCVTDVDIDCENEASNTGTSSTYLELFLNKNSIEDSRVADTEWITNEQPDQVVSDIDDCNYVQPSNCETKASSSKYDDVPKQQEEGKLEIPVKKKFKEMREKQNKKSKHQSRAAKEDTQSKILSMIKEQEEERQKLPSKCTRKKWKCLGSSLIFSRRLLTYNSI